MALEEYVRLLVAWKVALKRAHFCSIFGYKSSYGMQPSVAQVVLKDFSAFWNIKNPNLTNNNTSREIN